MILVMLPGLDGTGELFRPLMDALPAGIECRVISYPQGEYLGYEELVEYVQASLPVDEDYVLLAESFSGPIGFMLACRAPAHMQGLILVATFLQNPRRWLLRLGLLLPLGLLFRLPVPTYLIKRFLLGGDIDNRTIELFRRVLRTVNTRNLAFRLREITRLSMQKKTTDIRTCYIQAGRDVLVPEQAVKSVVRQCTRLQISRVDGPHFILQAQPAVCARIIADEIRSIEKPS